MLTAAQACCSVRCHAHSADCTCRDYVSRLVGKEGHRAAADAAAKKCLPLFIQASGREHSVSAADSTPASHQLSLAGLMILRCQASQQLLAAATVTGCKRRHQGEIVGPTYLDADNIMSLDGLWPASGLLPFPCGLGSPETDGEAWSGYQSGATSPDGLGPPSPPLAPPRQCQASSPEQMQLDEWKQESAWCPAGCAAGEQIDALMVEIDVCPLACMGPPFFLASEQLELESRSSPLCQLHLQQQHGCSGWQSSHDVVSAAAMPPTPSCSDDGCHDLGPLPRPSSDDEVDLLLPAAYNAWSAAEQLVISSCPSAEAPEQGRESGRTLSPQGSISGPSTRATGDVSTGTMEAPSCSEAPPLLSRRRQ